LTNESIESGHPGLLVIPEVEQPTQPGVKQEEYENFDDDSQWSSIY